MAPALEPTSAADWVPVVDWTPVAETVRLESTPPGAGSDRPARHGRFGWLGRKKEAPVVAEPGVETGSSVVADPPHRSSAWGPASGAPAAVHFAAASGGPAPAARPVTPTWAPQRDFVDPVRSTPLDAKPVAPARVRTPERAVIPVWREERVAPAPAGEDADGAQHGSSDGAHRAASPGAMDDEVAAMLALRSDIQEQAFAELGQLSAYRPTSAGASADGSHSLTRRVPAASSAEIVGADAGRASTRDADELRLRLSRFQAGSNRGRLASERTGSGTATGGNEPVVDHEIHDQTTESVR